MRPKHASLYYFRANFIAVLFIYSGADQASRASPATAEIIAAKVVIPALLAPYASQLETMTGMPTPQMLAIAIGAFEVISGLMIALNFGARFFAILLIFFVAVVDVLFPRFLESAVAGKCQNRD